MVKLQNVSTCKAVQHNATRNRKQNVKLVVQSFSFKSKEAKNDKNVLNI